MGTIDVSDVVNSPDFAEPFTIRRSSGGFVAGGWAQTTSDIPASGVISIAKDKDLSSLPEGDKVKEAIVVHSTQEIMLTSLANNRTSDLVIWMGQSYRVLSVANYSNRGYYKAIAERILGS